MSTGRRRAAGGANKASLKVARRKWKSAKLLGFGLLVVMTTGAFWYLGWNHDTRTVEVAERQEYTPYQGPPLRFHDEVLRAEQDVREAYQFVASHPEVAHYMPCYCGCWREGHRDNYDCFIDEVKADGTVTIDEMGFT